ncbi:MAG: Asp-tRNA(Asn)/Glu-tRNA(Gln) amidotransferase subunit GatB [Rickettsiales bacterium]|jgi:aspartyl-tRNA(Asn)/glutamyl-tRNA(Gln) amidotransferase subunit B|nr:Asp-tRNA(Asn)/Glu-tRNA(Gln) amidotransferase subunit GatB [Rickettsiales bacterium]
MSYTIKGTSSRWEVIVGLEVHCQLKTNSKLFSRSSAAFGAEPNSQVSFFDCAMPGQLPTLNENSVLQAIKTGIGLNAEFNRRSVFDRKNYFYPDLPQGYQITQFFQPIVRSGWLEIDCDSGEIKKIRIHEAHLEQDAGKSIHDQQPGATLIDLNRAGVTLLEIVSEPDMRSPAEAMEYLRKLRAMVRALDTCDGNMDEGSMRCDANVSVRRVGSDGYGTRCEIKNINSIKNVGSAIDYEAVRQVKILESGGVVQQETRRFEAETGITRTLRTKENAIDYRYFPEPDLAPLIISDEFIEWAKSTMPELPEDRKKRYIGDYSLSDYDARVLTLSSDIADYFDKLAVRHNPKLAANWLTTELLGRLNKLSIDMDKNPIDVDKFSELLDLVENGTISGKIAKDVLDTMLETNESAGSIVEKGGMRQITSSDEINGMIDRVMEENKKQVEQYRAGNERIFGFFVGQLMKLGGGRINPQLANELLREKLKVDGLS